MGAKSLTPNVKSTEIGKLNRKIEKCVSEVYVGTHGSTGKALSAAKKRETLLVARSTRKKIPA